MGYIIDKNGLKKDKDKIKASMEIPQPTTVEQVRSFVGMINYYWKVIPNLAQILQPLYNLLKKNSKFQWDKQCNKAFQKARTEVASDHVLVHYNLENPIRLACNASQAGMGGILMHIDKDGSQKPISFVSRVFSGAEKNYSVIHNYKLVN